MKKSLGFSEIELKTAAEVIAGNETVREGVDKSAAEIAEPLKPAFSFVNI